MFALLGGANMVKCQNCGFLSLRDGATRLIEADIEAREEGHTSHSGCSSTPYCFLMAIRIDKEPGPAEVAAPKRFVAIISRDRECSKFTDWHPGMSPKEHKEMIDEQRLREWQEERRTADRAFQAQQRHDDIERESRQREEDQKRDAARLQVDRDWQAGQARANRFWQIALALLAVAAGIFGVCLGSWLNKPTATTPETRPVVPVTTPK
jgi:hypothetical protein